MEYASMNREQLQALLQSLTAEYEAVKNKGLSLDLSRGKPCREQLDLSDGMLGCLSPEDCVGESGFDYRNYGLLNGTSECGQTAQIAHDALALYAKEDYFTSLLLQSPRLFLYEWCKMPWLIISDN